MSLTKHTDQKEKNDLLLNYKNMHPRKLLEIFKHKAPHALEQKDAQKIFKELTIYLTKEDELKLFQAWEDVRTEPGEFYCIVDELLDIYNE